MTLRTSVSALIITRNESKYIERCLKSLVWADEIVVVDAESTDDTPKLCLNPEAPWKEKLKFVRQPWLGFRKQRDFCLDQASHDWVLVVDSDEECSPELARKIQELLSHPGGPPLKAYKVHRQEYFLGKPIYWGIWNPSYQDRFFNRVGIRYKNDVHEYPPFPTEPGRIHEPLHHAPDFNIEKFLDKMNRYTSIEARDRVLQGKRTNAFRMIAAFPAMFLKNYFHYRSYRDGIEGFVISILEGISRAVRHVKMWQVGHALDRTQSEDL